MRRVMDQASYPVELRSLLELIKQSSGSSMDNLVVEVYDMEGTWEVSVRVLPVVLPVTVT